MSEVENPSLGAAIDALMIDVAARVGSDPAESYTSRLLAKGAQRIAKKVGEEGVELALALFGQDDAAVVAEAADVLYHIAVGLQLRGIDPALVGAELAGRRGTSGLLEKASRPVE
ncbi:MAG: phosphoribosyl-ATP diphosphatase [Hyphomonadaceae bacterium]|jgi:phosphoribosyl-ATP pyrophosphohydrolase|nr:phosphoribosyl-ATP diphosphatase [Hyphomonadaceae bacterium]